MLLVVLAACLLLSFGRQTFGASVDAIPGSSDIFFQRFIRRIQLAALLRPGGGAAWSARAISDMLQRLACRSRITPPGAASRSKFVPTTIALTVTILVLAPAWLQLGSYERDAAAISAQREPMARREPNSTD